jgi:acyl CoA:acetate/3-ketoacid CoA transferase alpha subunit/acyl CoA:acetate/3-ketoacid CoA transferase beta subunit
MVESKLMSLEEAVRKFAEPGLHLNFASTPSRSNAAVRQVARAFRGRNPAFTLSTTGFHSTAHLVALLGLGKKYVSCFFGDNYPIPRPNSLYGKLLADGVDLEFWSLWSYVSAFRAGALGQSHAVVRSLAGTTMGEDLEKRGLYAEKDKIGLVAAMRSDLTFIHAVKADRLGNAVFSPPYSEGFWGAIGARRGVIVTAEKIVEPEECAEAKDSIPIPRDRVLAVCHEPFGAHPQPFYVVPRLGGDGYGDDFEHYELWRAMSEDPATFARFEPVLTAADGREAYASFVGAERLEELRGRSSHVKSEPWEPAGSPRDVAIKANEILLVLAARKIAERVKEKRYTKILAGIGHSFLAARMAKLWLMDQGIDVKVMVETGLYDIECGKTGHEFLLSYDNIAQARRLTSVEDVLGGLACGADNSCLAVIGAGQVDELGRINSTRVTERLLVGSGGANDVASAASELIVLARCTPSRLVKQVDYITSPGERVSSVVTDLCTFTRAEGRWMIGDVYPAHGGRPYSHAVRVIKERCPWSLLTPTEGELAPVINTFEMRTVHTLDPRGVHWRRT